MGFSGCHIHGHSGTANKPRRPYFISKKYQSTNRSYNQSTNFYNSQPTKVYADKPYKVSNAEKFIKYGFKLPLLLICTSLCVLGARRYFGDLNQYTNDLNRYNFLEMAILDKEERINAYRLFTANGFRYLKHAEYKNAQIEFSNALQLIAEGERARIGLYTALSQQCILEGAYCEEAAVNLNYLKQMNYVGIKNKAD